MAEQEPKPEAAQHPEDPPKMAHQDDHKKPHKQEGSPSPRRGGGYAVRNSRRAICTFLVILLLLVGITALVLWLVYRPHDPKFRVISAAIYALNDTSPPFISAAVQFTVVIRNPNKRVSLLYDHLSAFVSYKNLPITPQVILPPLFHETKSTVALSPLLGGSPVLVAAEVDDALVMDQSYGVVELRLVLTGKVRYKGGGIKSRRYGIYVRCDLLVGLRRGYVGQLPLLHSPPCTVDV